MSVLGDLNFLIILYFSDHGHSIFYNGKEVSLSNNHAEMLKLFMLDSSEDRPDTKTEFDRLIVLEVEDGEVPS